MVIDTSVSKGGGPAVTARQSSNFPWVLNGRGGRQRTEPGEPFLLALISPPFRADSRRLLWWLRRSAAGLSGRTRASTERPNKERRHPLRGSR